MVRVPPSAVTGLDEILIELDRFRVISADPMRQESLAALCKAAERTISYQLDTEVLRLEIT